MPTEANKIRERYFEGLATHRRTNQLDRNVAAEVPFELNPALCAQLASAWFGQIAQKSLDTVTEVGRRSKWTDKLLSLLHTRMEAPRFPSSVTRRNSNLIFMSYAQLRYEVMGSTAVKELPCHSGSTSDSMVRAAQFRPATFSTKLSLDPSVESLKRALLSSHGSHRFAISADSRGLIALVEPHSIVLCTLAPLLNNAGKPYSDSAQNKSSIGIIGKGNLDFDIVGVKYSLFDERYLVVFGTHEAAVVVLDEYRTRIEATTTLDLGLGSIETSTDFVMECNWVPSSYPCVMVRCLHSLFIFEVSSKCSVLSPSSCYKASASNTTFRGAQVVQTDVRDLLKLFVLLEDGFLFDFNLELDATGQVRLPALTFESQKAVKLHTDEGSTTLCLGEGQNLSFLTQSRLLLYQCSTGGVLALYIDPLGKISKSFTLLPNVLSADTERADRFQLCAPFTHWTDLGAFEKDGVVSFRVACAGRRGAKDGAALCLEFNHLGTTVKELVCRTSEYSYASSGGIEGLAAFSAPLVGVDPDCFDLSRQRTVTENVAVAVLMSTGAMFIFVEKTGMLSSPRTADGSADFWNSTVLSDHEGPLPLPPEPLLAFENFENLTDDDEQLHVFTSLGR